MRLLSRRRERRIADAVITDPEQSTTMDSTGAVRSVTQALARNPFVIIVPCHRVVGANGDLTGYGGGLDRKRRLLAFEGEEGTLF